MARLLGYTCSDDTLTYCVVDEVADDIGRDGDERRLGHGFGWVNEGRSLLRKQPPQGASGVDLGSVIADIQAREIVGYECDPDSGPIDTLDLQPFSYRTWVYAQNGEVERLEEKRDEILEAIPDHIRRNIEGDSVEELCFHIFLTELQELGGFGHSQSDPEECAAAFAEGIEQATGWLEATDEDDGVFDTDVVAISERLLLAFAGREGMYYRTFDGIEEPSDEPLFAGHRPQAEEHPHFKAVLVMDGLESPSEEWTELDPQECLMVDGDWNAVTAPLAEFGA